MGGNTHLCPRDVGAGSTDELCRIIVVSDLHLFVTARLPAVVGLVTLKAHVVGVAVHGEARGVVVVPGAGSRDHLRLVQTLVLQPHEGLPVDVLIQVPDWLQHVLQRRMLNHSLRGARGEIREGDNNNTNDNDYNNSDTTTSTINDDI